MKTLMRYKVKRRAGYKQNRKAKTMKYRDTMTPQEQQQLLDECNKLDAIYVTVELDPADHKIEGSLAEFNRYIAGDR
jgi:hypothetical protein